MSLSLFFTLFTELFPLAMSAVHAVQNNAPAATPNASKFNAAVTAINDVVAAAPDASNTYNATKAAIANGDGAAIIHNAGHMVELALSVSKSLGLFPKAGVVQNAAPIEQLLP